MYQDIPEFEKKRLLRKQENDQTLEQLRIKRLTSEHYKNKDKELVEDGASSLQFDKEYIPGGDSLCEGEEEEIRSKQENKNKKNEASSTSKDNYRHRKAKNTVESCS